MRLLAIARGLLLFGGLARLDSLVKPSDYLYCERTFFESGID